MLKSLMKAALAVVVTPVAAVADVLSLPASALHPHRGPFDLMSKCLHEAAKNIGDAIEPEEKK